MSPGPNHSPDSCPGLWGLIGRSLLHNRRTHLWSACATALAAAALCGALMVGDSLRTSLERLVDVRLGRVHWALLATQDRFRLSLADSLQAETGISVAPALLLPASVTAAQGRLRANTVTLAGVDERFWMLGPQGTTPVELADDEAAVGEALGRKLDLQPGDYVVVRFERGDLIPLEAPFSGGEGSGVHLRLRVRAIVRREAFGEFRLGADHGAAHTLFAPLQVVAAAANRPGYINAALFGHTPPHSSHALHQALRRRMQLADCGLSLRAMEGASGIEVVANTIFLSDSLRSTLQRLYPGGEPVFTYFVNTLGRSSASVPYSFVSTPPSGLALPPGGIALNRWAAGQLQARPGDSIHLDYFVLRTTGELDEQRADFTLTHVVPTRGPWTDSALMPPYPGLGDAASCFEWNPGIPIDLDRIEPRDEAYWERWRGTPKAYVRFETAQRLWGNRFGSATAFRLPPDPDRTTATVEADLLHALEPGFFGLHLEPVRAEALRAVEQGIEFAPLFTALSMYLIVAALVLVGLMFGFTLQARHDQYRLLAAVGWPRRQIRMLFTGEGLVVAAAGAAAGASASPLYAAVLLALLRSVWRGAAPTPLLQLSVSWTAAIIGATAAFLMAGATLSGAVHTSLKRFFRHSSLQTPSVSARRLGAGAAISVLCGAAALLIIAAFPSPGGNTAAAVVMIAGALFMVSMLAAFDTMLLGLLRPSATPFLTVGRLVLLNAAGRRSGVVGTALTFALALFVLGSVGGFRQGPITNSLDPASGTGGFRWYARTTHPIAPSQLGANYLHERGLDTSSGYRYAAFRLRDGDDASCFTLNRVSRPPLLGADGELLHTLGAFSFAALHHSVDPTQPWRSLARLRSPTTVAGVADMSVIEWGLGMSLGDTLRYTDERGGSLNVVLVGGVRNSVMQGKVIIAESDFVARFPSSDGYRVVLLDGRAEQGEGVAEVFRSVFRDKGIDLEPAAQRLAAFNEVENTYIAIFSMLGIVGLVLGSAGMGITVMKNMAQRRGEFALLTALGYRRNTIIRIAAFEHFLPLTAGATSGLGAALISAALVVPGDVVAMLPGVAATLAAVLAVGLLCSLAAATFETRRVTMRVLAEES